MSLLPKSRSHLLTAVLQKDIFVVFLVMILSKANFPPRIQPQAPPKTPKNDIKTPRISPPPPQPSTIVVSSRTFKKFSSNGLDFAELEPKQVDHRRIPTGPVSSVQVQLRVPPPKIFTTLGRKNLDSSSLGSGAQSSRSVHYVDTSTTSSRITLCQRC